MSACASCIQTRTSGRARRLRISPAPANSPATAPSPSMRRASGRHRPARWSGSKQLLDIFEGLEFQRIPRRIEKKQGGLLARFAVEANIRLNDELDLVTLQPVCE